MNASTPASAPRTPFYSRLPEIYRTHDHEPQHGQPPGQLQAYMAAFEFVFGHLHENIEDCYHDFFVETCADWAVPYHGDLLGSSHLAGPPRPPLEASDPDWVRRQLFMESSDACYIPLLLDPTGGPARDFGRTLRADVADTIALRRRKGTPAALERLARSLTGWAAHIKELRENLSTIQHLNHFRPDAGDKSPFSGLARVFPRGGTVALRRPAELALLGTAFDPFGRIADFKPAVDDVVHYNLPNIAIFLWRLQSYRLSLTVPRHQFDQALTPADATKFASHAVGFDLDQLSLPKPAPNQPAKERPVRLFNTWPGDLASGPGGGSLNTPDRVPAPMVAERLAWSSSDPDASPYVSIDLYTPGDLATCEETDVGLQFFVPEGPFIGAKWSVRGENLCAWTKGLERPLRLHEVVVDPVNGRVLFGVSSVAQRDALKQSLLAAYCYGAPGPVGAHPSSRSVAPERWPITEDDGVPTEIKRITAFGDAAALRKALDYIGSANAPVVIEIGDSLVHDLDPEAILGVTSADGPKAIPLAHSLIIRAANNQRPIIRLANSLRFRPTKVEGADAAEQAKLDAIHARLTVRLEGIFLTRHTQLATSKPLIDRIALGRLEILGCTLDPGGHRQRGGTRAPLGLSIRQARGLGFAASGAEGKLFASTPDIVIQRSVVGGLAIDEGSAQLSLKDSIVDAGAGVGENGDKAWALTAAGNAEAGWAPSTKLDGVTFFGRVRVFEAGGQGGIFTHRLEVLRNQHGCLSFCWFSGQGNRLPANHACQVAVPLGFVSEWHGDPGYGQLARNSDPDVLARGPYDDAMGAYGFLFEAHKWANLKTRFREFMPVGVRPLLIPLT